MVFRSSSLCIACHLSGSTYTSAGWGVSSCIVRKPCLVLPAAAAQAVPAGGSAAVDRPYCWHRPSPERWPPPGCGAHHELTLPQGETAGLPAHSTLSAPCSAHAEADFALLSMLNSWNRRKAPPWHAGPEAFAAQCCVQLLRSRPNCNGARSATWATDITCAVWCSGLADAV